MRIIGGSSQSESWAAKLDTREGRAVAAPTLLSERLAALERHISSEDHLHEGEPVDERILARKLVRGAGDSIDQNVSLKPSLGRYVTFAGVFVFIVAGSAVYLVQAESPSWNNTWAAFAASNVTIDLNAPGSRGKPTIAAVAPARPAQTSVTERSKEAMVQHPIFTWQGSKTEAAMVPVAMAPSDAALKFTQPGAKENSVAGQGELTKPEAWSDTVLTFKQFVQESTAAHSVSNEHRDTDRILQQLWAWEKEKGGH
ncbi:MAG: hypothetical protein WBX25_19580 [Rhodomicrobium sp.]